MTDDLTMREYVTWLHEQVERHAEILRGLPWWALLRRQFVAGRLAALAEALLPWVETGVKREAVDRLRRFAYE